MADSLFEQIKLTQEPLAARMRPRNLDEYIGQDHIVGKGRLLRRAIAADQLTSVIFYGPPGSGKTTVLVQRISQIILYGNAYYGSNGIEATENDIAGLEAIAENAAMLDRNTLKDVLSTFAVRSAEPYRILSITFTNKAAG